MDILSQANEIEVVLQDRIFHPTVQLFFDRYKAEGCLDEYANILDRLSSENQEMILSAQSTQVHKEKALLSSVGVD